MILPDPTTDRLAHAFRLWTQQRQDEAVAFLTPPASVQERVLLAYRHLEKYDGDSVRALVLGHENDSPDLRLLGAHAALLEGEVVAPPSAEHLALASLTVLSVLCNDPYLVNGEALRSFMTPVYRAY